MLLFIYSSDIYLLKPKIEVEIAKSLERKARSKAEQAYARRRELVAQEYHRRRSDGSKHAILPTLNVFREQQTIVKLQDKHSTVLKDIAEKLKTPFVQQAIYSNLSVWEDKAARRLTDILGYSTGATNTLRPIDRLTARFICSKCSRNSRGKRELPSLDFREACAHMCPHLTKKQKAKTRWTAEQFEPDHKVCQNFQLRTGFSGHNRTV